MLVRSEAAGCETVYGQAVIEAALSEPDYLESRVSRYREQRGGADVKHIELESGLNH